MTKIKDFLDKRTVGLGKKPMISEEKSIEEKVRIEKKFRKKFENLELEEKSAEDIDVKDQDIIDQDVNNESEDLSDEEFWDISNSFMKKIQKSNRSHMDILEEILEDYTSHKIRQFAKRYEELNH